MNPKNIKNAVLPSRPEVEEVFMNATSTSVDPMGRTKVVLYWKPVPHVVGYNIYRSNLTRPLNGATPIRQADTCAKFKAIIPEGSREWNMLAHAFSSVTGRRSIKVVADGLRRGRVEDASGLFFQRTLSPGTSMDVQNAVLEAGAVNPCDAIQRGLTDEEQALFDSLASANLKLRIARGLAAIDGKVTTGKTYTYELRGVLENGTELILDKDVTIKAGFFKLPQPPSGFSLMAGDSEILALWNRNNYAFSYLLERSDSVGGTYYSTNESPIIYNITKDLHDQDLTPPRPGFLDFQRWDDEGLPVPHKVKGVDVGGPSNGGTYYYRAASCDILGRHGNWSASLRETPLHATPPMTPTDLRVDVNSSPFGLILSWRKVTRDVRHHQILDSTQTYKIYRADLLDNLDDITTLPAYLIGELTADPTDPATITLSWLDTDPVLRVPYGEKDFWYRIHCVDAQGNESAPSAAIAGRLPDITPPGPTSVTGADGHADHVSIYWDANTEPDLAGYQIYRGICDQGKPYRPEDLEHKEKGPCDFVLVGEVSLKQSSNRLAETGRIYFEDYSVPAGSPLCYCYWIRAFDIARNLYPGDDGCPDRPDEYTCQRLYEETPPPVPVISALKARDSSVLIEWIASPLQDLRAFHIYRSDKEDKEPDFIGCVLSDGIPWPGRWTGEKPKCDDIPAEVDPASVHGSFLDKTVEANHIYWYRVSALDWLGNESEAAEILRIPAISTFTYTKRLPATPALLPPAASPGDGCGLIVSWSPAFDPVTMKGYLVFRSMSSAGNYRQVSSLVQANSFEDHSAIRGIDYWYRVQSMSLDGTLSPPSASVHHRY